MHPILTRSQTGPEKRLMREWDKFQDEYRQLRALHALQIERLYAAYKPRLDTLSLRVTAARWTEDEDPETY